MTAGIVVPQVSEQRSRFLFCAMAVVVIALARSAAAQTSTATCPWGLGWAAGTPAGAGGKILHVTTLAATGAGSLPAALQAEGPRIVVFDVGGVIDLGGATIKIQHPFLTLAAQTAPAPGITLIRGGLHIVTHDVLIQHLRIRPGEAGRRKRSGWNVDGIETGNGASNVIVDHCSMTWATDENLSAGGSPFVGDTPDDWRANTSRRITFSNNIVAEGLSRSTHSKGEHSKGTLVHDNATDIAVVRNLYASNVDRNPFFKGGSCGVVVNNYIANPGTSAVAYALHDDEWGAHPHQIGKLAVVGNVIRSGPDTRPGIALIDIEGEGTCEVFADDNRATTGASVDMPILGGKTARFVQRGQPPTWPPGLAPMPADAVRDYIEKNVGARPWDRDAIDARIVARALAGDGQIIDSEDDAEGYPQHRETRAPFDSEAWDLTCMRRKTDAR